MSYPEKDMTELSKTPKATELNPRVTELESKFFARFSEALPMLSDYPVASRRLLPLARQFAEEQAQLEKENASLLEQSDRDPYNPEVHSNAGWQRSMKDILAELRRNKQHAAIVAWDLDGFKQYNDLYASHLQGNKALGLAGSLAKAVLRPGDLIARPHGDEFLAVLPGAGLQEGVIAAERVRTAIAGMPALLETTIPLTASLGVVVLSDQIVQTRYESDEQLNNALKLAYDLADKAQYNGAKKVGKNKIGVMQANGEIQTAVVQLGTEGQPAIITYQSLQPFTSAHK